MDTTTAEALLQVATESRQGLRGPDAEAVQAGLTESYDDIGRAFEHFLAGRRVDEALRLASALVPFWMATKRIAEGDAWFERALGAGSNSNAVRARALYEHGYLVFWAGDYARSARRANEAVAMGRAAGDPTVVALALALLARTALSTDVPEAIRLLREAIAETEGTDDRDGRSSALHVLGVAYQMSGAFEDARRVMSERIALGREMDNPFMVAVESANLSMVERQVGNLDAAADLSREAMETFHRLGDAMAVAWSANGHAAVTAAQGDLDRSARLLGFAEAAIERAGGEWPPDERQQYEGTLEALRVGMEPDTLEQARLAGSAMSTEEAIALTRPG